MPIEIPNPPSAPLVPANPDQQQPSSLNPASPAFEAGRNAVKKGLNTAYILSAAFILLITGIVGFVLWSFMGPEWANDQLLKTGRPATGTIVDVTDTGNRFNEQPQVEVTVDVKPPKGEIYRAKTLMIISPVYLPQFQPGKKVNVKYSADDPSKIAIE